MISVCVIDESLFEMSYLLVEYIIVGCVFVCSMNRGLGPDYQNACKVTIFSTLYLELQHESYNVPAVL